MTEAEARFLLRDWPGVGGLEAWIADRCWKPEPGGWSVIEELEGWHFWIKVIPGGLEISADVSGGEAAIWTVPG